MLIDKGTKRKREQLLRLRCSRYRQTPIYLKRVKAHAIRREPSTSFLIDYWNLANFEQQESKRTLQRICLFISFSAHRQFQFLGFNNYYFFSTMQLSITQAWASSHTFCVQIYELFPKVPNNNWKNSLTSGKTNKQRVWCVFLLYLS